MQTFVNFLTFFFALTCISISILPYVYCFDESTVQRVQEQNQLEKAIFHYFEKRSVEPRNDNHFQKRASSSGKDKSFQHLQSDGKGSPPSQHASTSDSHPPPTTHYIDSKGYHMYVGPPLHPPKPEQKTGRSSYYSDELRQKTIASLKPVYPNHRSSTTSSSPPSPPPASTSLTIRQRREFHLLPSQMEKYHDLIKENEPYSSIKVYKDTKSSSSGGSSPKSNRSPKRNSSFKKRSINEFGENTFKHFEKRASGSDKDKNFQNLQNDKNQGSPLKQHDTIPGSSEQSNTNHYVNSHGYKYYVGSPINQTDSNERKVGNQRLSPLLREKKMATLKPLHPTSSSPSTPHSTDQIVFGSKQREYHLEPNSVEKYKETIKRNDQNATIKSIEKPLPSSIGLKKDYKGSSNRSPPRSPEHE